MRTVAVIRSSRQKKSEPESHPQLQQLLEEINALEFEPGAFHAEATAQPKNTANYLKTTSNLSSQKKYEELQAEFHAYKQILGLIDLLEREHKAQNPATAPAIARLIEYGKNCLGSHDLTFREKYERFHREYHEYKAFTDIQKLIPKLQKLQANANAEEEPIAAPAIARLIQNAKDSLAGDGPSFTKKYKILKDEHAAILSIRKLISLLKTKKGNSSAIQQLIKDAKDCLNLAYDDPLFQEKYRALNTKYKALSKIQEIATSLATFYQAEAKNISEAAEKAIKKLQDIVNEFPQDANSSLEETAKKLSEGIQNYEAARKEYLKVREIEVSYGSRWRTNPERLAVIEAMLKMTDKLFDGTMTVNDFQNSVADRPARRSRLTC